jgi:two-component system, cell cycle response regulator DivK
MSKKILVVEDYDDSRQMMKTFLELNGYDVLEARDGYEAVEKAVEERPNLILMDVSMPALDGVQATNVIRQHDSLASVPILAITAYGDFYDDRARRAGCNEVLTKPVDIGKLAPMVKEYLR